MAQSMIRWTRSDYAKLSRAIRDFNNKIDKLEELQDDLNLPEKYNYNVAKNEIMTRQELNRVINKLKRFKKEDATEKVEGLTKWERNELMIENRVAQTRLGQQFKRTLEEISQKEFKNINEAREFYNSNRGGIGMGDERLQTLTAEIQNLKNIKNYSGKELERKIARIKDLGSSDYKIRQAYNYRERYLRVMKENYSNFKGFDEFYIKLESIKNPFKFYERIKDYENEADLYYQSNQQVSQQNFNRLLEAWGVESEDIQDGEIYS